MFALFALAVVGQPHGQAQAGEDEDSTYIEGELPADSVTRFLQDISAGLKDGLCINWGPLPG